MNDDIAIKVDHVSKSFKLPHERQSSIKGAIINAARGGRNSYERQEVLRDVSFEIKSGEFFGIVGRNGSGKSTLLKLLAGIYAPTKGTIQVNGKLTPFIELGVGFNMELTGRENVFLNGALLGFNRSEMLEMYDDIVSFAELDKFMDQKLKNYSSGMQVRLAFSIAIRAESHILLLDEVLAVGDAIFQQKCFDYFKELKRKKRTVVLVSHDSGALQKYCDKGILIEKGVIQSQGPIQKVINDYQSILLEHEEATQQSAPEVQLTHEKHGAIEVNKISITADDTTNRTVFSDTDRTISIAVTYRANEDVESPIYGVTINDVTGAQVFASNTYWHEIGVADMAQGQSQTVIWKIPNFFNTGTYSVSPAVANSSGAIMYDWKDAMATFKIRKKLQSTALVNVEHDLILKDQHSNKE